MSPRDGRALVVGGVIIATAVVALRVVPSGISAVRRANEALDARALHLARLRLDLRGAGALEDSGRVVRERLVALAPKLLAGGAEAEALLHITGRLDAAAARHRVKVERTDRLADSVAAGRLRRIAVRVALEGDTQGVLEMLRELEAGDPVLALMDLRIVAVDPGSSEPVPEVLRAEVSLGGWYMEGRVSP